MHHVSGSSHMLVDPFWSVTAAHKLFSQTKQHHLCVVAGTVLMVNVGALLTWHVVRPAVFTIPPPPSYATDVPKLYFGLIAWIMSNSRWIGVWSPPFLYACIYGCMDPDTWGHMGPDLMLLWPCQPCLFWQRESDVTPFPLPPTSTLCLLASHLGSKTGQVGHFPCQASWMCGQQYWKRGHLFKHPTWNSTMQQ